jgi:DNA repair exonuclease SbcCD ATPase subunit
MKLMTHGLKANDRVIELGRLTLFTGPNGAGKSTLLNAIQFAALGYVPMLGKRPLDTFALMADSTMEVDLVLDDGRTVHRSISKTGNGFQASAEVSWLKNSKSTETGKEILRLFGGEEIDVAEALDIRQLLNATPNQRASRIEQMLESGKRPAAEIAAAVAKFTLMRLVPNLQDGNVPENHLDLLPLITKAHKAALQANASMLESKIVEAGIAGALVWANEEKRSASTSLKRKEEAAHQMRLRAVEVLEPDEREIETLIEQRDALHRDLGVLTEKWNQFEAKASVRRRLVISLAEAKKVFETARSEMDEVQGKSEKAISALKLSIKKSTDSLMSLSAPAAPSAAAVEALQKEIDALQAEMDALRIPIVPGTHEEAHAVRQATAEIERVKSSPWSEVLEIALEFKRADKGKNRAARLEAIAREALGTDIEGLEHELERCKIALKEATSVAHKAREEAERIEMGRAALKASCQKKAGETNRLRSQMNEAHVKALAAFDGTKRNLLNQRQEAEQALAVIETHLEEVETNHRAADSRYQSLNEQLAMIGNLPPAPDSSETIAAKLASAKVRLDVLINARAVHAEIQRAISILEEAKSSRDVFAAIEWALQKQREVEISESGGPLKKYMARFLEAAGRKETPFIEAGPGGIGWIVADNRRIQVAAMSGGEFALYTAALTAAVLLSRKAELKILLIEAGETDPVTLAQILRGTKAVSKGLNAVLVLTPHAPETGIDGWSVVSLTSEHAGAVA